MDGGRRSRGREEYSSGGYAMEFSSLFHRSKRPRAEDPPSEEEKENSVFEPSADSSMGNFMSSASTAASPWRLPSNQTLVDNQKYLNEQLQHVVALSSMLGSRSSGPENGARRFLAKEKAAEDDVDKVCTLDLAKVWRLLAVGMAQQTEEQKRAESGVREVMDLVSYLLYVRDRELDHQNRLSENLGRVEKQLERKNHIVQTLTTDLETLKQNFAQKENVFKAKEKSLMAERKTLQMEKKSLEVNCARKNLEGDAEELEKLAKAPIDDFTPTPFNMATKEGIPQYISASMEALDGKLKQLEHVIRNELPSAEARSDKEVIKRLRQKLDDAHAIINEQDQLLQASLSSPAVDVRVADARSSPNAAAEEDVAQKKSELTLLRQNLEKERRLLQEQAVKLDKDRLEFEIAKRDQVFASSDDAMMSSSPVGCSTPKRQGRAKRFDVDGPDSPFDIPVSGT
ncbi:hypothetical protein JG688_00009702 [Phytophthora aleatoria]|uniref:Uncharacterized protein n=1 Tax=Phytophthora aleatoria TaxID=2496075 RepID=A0A8J5IKV2_9STRA|nr:hypothetical protein JG688_00009702 [Phytophthora aleatoria]